MPLTRVEPRSRRRSARSEPGAGGTGRPRSTPADAVRAPGPDLDLAIAAIRTLPFGGMDDSTRELSLASGGSGRGVARRGGAALGLDRVRHGVRGAAGVPRLLRRRRQPRGVPVRHDVANHPPHPSGRHLGRRPGRPDGRHRAPRPRGRIRGRPRELADLLCDRAPWSWSAFGWGLVRGLIGLGLALRRARRRRRDR